MRLPEGQDIQAVLTGRGLLSGSALERVRRLRSETGERIDRIAAKLGLISDRDLAHAYATLLGFPVVTANEFPAAPVAPDRVSLGFIRRARLVPLAETDTALTVAMADPLDDGAVRALEFALSKPVHRRSALPADIDAALDRLYAEGGSAIDQIYAAVGGRSSGSRADRLTP